MKELIQQILDGDKEAFRTIIQKFSPQLVKLAYRFTWNWDEAREITHRTFIKVYRSMHRFDVDRPFEPWIYRVHINTCKSNYKSNQLRKKILLPLEHGKNHSASSSVDYDASKDIQNCINTLTWKQKTAFILMEIQGFSSKEAGEIMGCSGSTARVHLKRAKINLRNRLKKMGYNYE
jgi:RNA polymerase sigma-70 factor (ECF subfamily)